MHAYFIYIPLSMSFLSAKLRYPMVRLYNQVRSLKMGAEVEKAFCIPSSFFPQSLKVSFFEWEKSEKQANVPKSNCSKMLFQITLLTVFRIFRISWSVGWSAVEPFVFLMVIAPFVLSLPLFPWAPTADGTRSC